MINKIIVFTFFIILLLYLFKKPNIENFWNATQKTSPNTFTIIEKNGNYVIYDNNGQSVYHSAGTWSLDDFQFFLVRDYQSQKEGRGKKEPEPVKIDVGYDHNTNLYTFGFNGYTARVEYRSRPKLVKIIINDYDDIIYGYKDGNSIVFRNNNETFATLDTANGKWSLIVNNMKYKELFFIVAIIIAQVQTEMRRRYDN